MLHNLPGLPKMSPLLKNTKCKNLSVSFLKKIILPQSRIDSYGLYDGNLELSLSSVGHRIRAHTEKKIVYEFWQCVCYNPALLHRILTYDRFVFKGEDDFSTLQETLPTQKDIFMRSSIFFLLNRCSESGYASFGKYDDSSYNSYALRRLKNFRAPSNFNFFYHNQSMHSEMTKKSDCDYVIAPSLNFNFNLFEHGKSVSYDTHNVVHATLKSYLQTTHKKAILIYNFHHSLLSYYKDFNIYFIDKYGKICFDENNCEEIVVTNF